MAGTSVSRGSAWAVVGTLTAVVFVFVGIRLSQDIPAVFGDSSAAPGSFEERYAQHPIPAYLHILPGVTFLAIAPFQVSRRFRRGRIPRHRSMGRVAAAAAAISGVFALVVGIWFPFGGVAEASATVVFGLWFLTAIVRGVVAARAHDRTTHRRWMIRAFSMGVAVGTIRLVIATSQAFGATFEGVFGPAFWVAFVLHAAAAEAWLRWRPETTAVPSAA